MTGAKDTRTGAIAIPAGVVDRIRVGSGSRGWQPTLRVGTTALIAAALAWLAQSESADSPALTAGGG